MMKNTSCGLRLIVILLLSFAITSCASINLTNYVVPEEPPPVLADKTIAVPTFKGSISTLDPTSEWFAHKLSMSGKLDVVSPAQVEIILSDKNKMSLLKGDKLRDAALIGQEIGADLVTKAFIYIEKSKMHWNVVCEVTLIDCNNMKELGRYKVTEMIMDNFDPVVYYMRAANKVAFEIIGAKKVQ